MRFLITVEDTGMGIKAEEMDKLFVPFDRLDISRNRSIEGAGLGLSISRQLLHMMNSELKVESIYGQGSRFYFSIWQEISDFEEIGEFRPSDRKRQARKADGQRKYFTAPGRRILVVDDMTMNLQVLTGLLKRSEMIIETASGGEDCIRKFGEQEFDIVFLDYRMPGMDGFETLCASSGAEALDILKAAKPDVIVLDYAMPVMDGPALYREIKAGENTKDIPVIFRTGKEDEESEAVLKDLAPAGVVPKSEGKPGLLGILNDVIK